jgi:RHS repeat-associated protein
VKQNKVTMAIVLMVSSSVVAWANSVPIGILSYDVVTPMAGGPPGINALNLIDLTDAFSLPPDFPVSSTVVFMNATLWVTADAGPPESISLGDVMPGPLLNVSGNPLIALEFPSTTQISSVAFTATMSLTDLELATGSAFTADPTVTATLLPSSGSFLNAGDVVPVMAQPAGASTTPELPTGKLMFAALFLAAMIRVLRLSLPVEISASGVNFHLAKRLTDFLRRGIGIFLVGLVLFPISPVRAQTSVTLSSPASPSVGQPGVTSINIVGSGFPTASISPAGVLVALNPMAPGSPSSTITAASVITIVGTTRRISFIIPSIIIVSAPTAYNISISGTASDGTHFQSGNTATLTINPPAGIISITPASGQPGQSLSVTLKSAYTNFVQGATSANFGTNISVGGGPKSGFGLVTVTNPTTATAQIMINGSATPGPRTVTLASGIQEMILPNGFSVATADGGLPPDPRTVAPPLDTSVATRIDTATAFLYSGANPIQTGVAPNTIVPTRAAVIRGKVLDTGKVPLSGVTITIFKHPEFGQTISRADGMFDIAVNGGGLLAVNYAKPGLLTAQRQVQAPWQDFVFAPDVILIPQDIQVTTVQLTGPASLQFGPAGRPALTPNSIQVARGSVIKDNDGTRQATLIFQPGTQATMSMPDGSTQPISVLSVHATEYSVGPNGPAAMPGDLPSTSGYTYAVEFTSEEAAAAGAVTVNFSQPVIQYVENFLNFPVGEVVPEGYYDRTRAVWVPSHPGRVVRVLNLAGAAAALDIDGSGQPASATALAALGVTTAELVQVAGLYVQGQSLWRVPITHFSAWDSNWGFGPPPDAGGPGGGAGPQPQGGPEPDDPEHKCGSIIECESQVLGESIPLTGTSLTLNYRSDRVVGRIASRTLDIPLSGSSIPASLKRIDLEVLVAGRLLSQSFPPNPNQTTRFTWDGTDAYGRSLQGNQPVTIRVGYSYDGLYQSTSRFGDNGNGAMITGNSARQEVTFWAEWKATIGSWDGRETWIGGWSLSNHHAYDMIGKILYLGTGLRRSVTNIPTAVNTVAGTDPSSSGVGDGMPANSAGLNAILGIAVDAEGILYFSDRAHGPRIRKITADGIIHTIAGRDQSCSGPANSIDPTLPCGDGGSAINALLLDPVGVAVGPDGSVYFAENALNRVRKIGPDGIISTVAGTGIKGHSGDGGPAMVALLSGPNDVAVAPDGSLYIAEIGAGAVRRVGTDGVITTVAGGAGPPPFPTVLGDGGPAAYARFNVVWSVAVGPDGSVYVSDAGRVRKIGPDGIINTATANVDPRHISVAPDGVVFIADTLGKIYRLGLDTTISIVAGAGTGSTGFQNGTPATSAFFSNISGMALGPNGFLYAAYPRHVSADAIAVIGAALPGVQIGEISMASEDGRELFIFSQDGRHSRTLDALTGAVRFQFTYDAASRLINITDGDGRIITVERSSGNPTAIVAPFGQRTILTTNSGYLTGTTNPAGEVTSLTYSTGQEEGLLTSFTNARGGVSRFQYDDLGRLVVDTDPMGAGVTLARTQAGSRTTVSATTQLGHTTTYVVETLPTGEVHRVMTEPSGAITDLLIGTDGSRRTTYPDGTIATLAKGPDARWGLQTPTIGRTITIPGGPAYSSEETRVTIFDPLNPTGLKMETHTITLNGRVFKLSFDASSNTFTRETPAGRLRTITVDSLGRVTGQQDSGLAGSKIAYDSLGRPATVTRGTGTDARTETFSYSSKGELQSVTDPVGQSTQFERDAAGRIVRTTTPDGRVVLAAYDSGGNVTSVTPPGRSAHTFTYDAFGQIAQYVPPMVNREGAISYAYNVDHQLTAITQSDGTSLTTAYDSAGRMTSRTITRGTYTYGYDSANGHLTKVGGPDSDTLTYNYSGALFTGTTWSGPASGSVSQAFNSNFQVISSNVNGGPLTVSYDPDGLITQAGDLTITRDPQKGGLVTSTSLGNVKELLSYNDFGELTGTTATYNGTTLLAELYARDKLGRITQMTETIGGATNTYNYSYDPAGRLAAVQQNGTSTATYTYDDNGNRISVNRAGATLAGVYDSQDRLTLYGSTSYQYAAAGALRTKTSGGSNTTFAYDELGDLSSTTLADGRTISYLADGRGRRVVKKVDGTAVQAWLYEDRIHPAAELNGANQLVTRFVYTDQSNAPAYMVKSGVTYRILMDQTGSPRLVIDVSTGAIAQRMDYDGFGSVVRDTNPGFQPFGFGGGLYDPDTGLVRFGARDYDAESGRWTSKDPISFAARDTNLYAYVYNDPVNLSDPFGLQVAPLGELCEEAAWEVFKYLAEPSKLTPFQKVGFVAGKAGTAADLYEWTHGEKGGLGTLLDCGACLTLVPTSCMACTAGLTPPPGPLASCDYPGHDPGIHPGGLPSPCNPNPEPVCRETQPDIPDPLASIPDPNACRQQ